MYPYGLSPDIRAQEKENKSETTFEKIEAENFLKPIKDFNPHIHDAQRTTIRINIKKKIHGNIIIKLLEESIKRKY